MKPPAEKQERGPAPRLMQTRVLKLLGVLAGEPDLGYHPSD